MANRFWVAQPVSGAIVSPASPPQVRLTVSSTTGMTTGDVRIVSGIVGTTEANGTWTITVIDGTHIDLQGTTFANLYTSGGIVIGKWNSTNTNNWVTTSGGTNYGQTVPGSVDAVTLDGSSGGSTVIVDSPNGAGVVTVQSITSGAFTGTLDFSANNNNVTISGSNAAWAGSGTGTRTINLGNGTWTLTGTGGIWSFSITTGLTFNANSSVITFTATTASTRTMSSGTGLTYNTVNISANTSGGVFNLAQACTIANLNVTAPNAIIVTSGITITTSNAFTWTGSSSGQIKLASATNGTAATIAAAASSTMSWAGLSDMTFTGSPTATSSFDLGHNSGITITPPSASTSIVSTGVIGGGFG